MGVCYLKLGYDVDVVKKKFFYSKKNKNGINLIIEYSLVRFFNYDEDKLFIFDEKEVENDRVVLEYNGNVERQCFCSVDNGNSKVVCSGKCVSCDGGNIGDLLFLDEVVSLDFKVISKVVLVLDSGIESLYVQELYYFS